MKLKSAKRSCATHRPVSDPWALLLLAAVVVATAGCAQSPLTYTGFLGDYGQLSVDPDREDKAIYRNQAAEFHRYQKVIIDEPVIYHHEKAGKRRLDPELRERVVTEMKEAIRESVHDSFLEVQEPGPETLRIRTAVNQVMPTRKGDRQRSVVLRVPIDFDDSHMEAEVLDSVTNERLLAVVDTRYGRGYRDMGDMVRWDQVRKLLRQWTGTLRREMVGR